MVDIESLDKELCAYCPYTEYGLNDVNTNQYNQCEGMRCEEAYENYKESEENTVEYKQVIFNKPATIVIWEDGSKTVVKCSEKDKFKKKMGFLMAYFQKHSGLTKHQSSKILKNLGKDNAS